MTEPLDLTHLTDREWDALREAEDQRRLEAVKAPWVRGAYEQIRDRLVPKSYRIPDSREIQTIRWIAFNLRPNE